MVTGEESRDPVGLPSDWAPVIESLVGSLEDARHFRGSLVVVHGPPGVGKSRVIDGALARANVSNRRIRRTFLEARDVESPYKAVLSLARWAAKLEEIAPALDSGSLVVAPFIRALASGGAEFGGSATTPKAGGADAAIASDYQRLLTDLEFYKRGVEAWGERSRFLHEVGWMILDAAARRHVLWIIDSAQYLDPHSLAVVRYLAGCLDENPLLMWLNVDSPRNRKLPPTIAALLEHPRARPVEVPRLSRAGVREVLGWKFPGRTFPDRVVDAVFQESRGLLFTVEQIASNPRLLRSPSHGRAGETAPALRVGMRRLEALSPTARELVEKLAVLGEETSLAMATRLARRGEDDVRRDLKELVSTGFLLAQEGDRYCFRLTGFPVEIEARLDPDRRRQLHREAAEALSTSSPDFEELVFDLADHWRKAEAWEAAARAALVAARFSSDNFAPEGGALHAQRALDAARKLSDRRPILEAEALVEKGRALYDQGRLHESLGALRESVHLIGNGPDVWPSRARALFYLARALSSLARPPEAFEVVNEAKAALAKVDDPRAQMMLHQVIGVAFMMTGQNREAVDHFRPMLALAQALGDPREVSYAQKNLSAVLLAVDPRDEEGWQLVNAALDYHTRTGNFAGLAAGYLNRGSTKLELHDVEGALKDLARSRQAAELAHAPLLIASATLQEATVLLDQGAADRAAGLLKALAPWMPTMEEPAVRVAFALQMGRVAEAQQRSDEAERLYEEATCMAEPGGESPALWECRLRRAALARRVGAVERFRRLAEALPSVEEINRSAPGLASLRGEIEAAVG